MYTHTPTSSRRRQRGQGMSEYLIIVALIAVAAIGVVGFFGDTVSNQLAAMSREIAGQQGDTQTAAANRASQAAAQTANSHKTLATYASDNGQ